MIGAVVFIFNGGVKVFQIVHGKDFTAVAPVFLRAVERFVGSFYQHIDVIGNCRRRNTDTYGKGYLLTLVGINDDFRNGFAQAVSHNFGFFRREFGQKDDKFLTAVTGNNVILTQRPLGGRRKFNQHLVAGFMAIGIVDAFEMVGVYHQNAVLRMRRLCLGYAAVDFVFKIAAVKQRGQRIADSLVFQHILAVFARCNILERRINGNVVIIVNDIGRSQKPERRIAVNGFGQDFKVMDFFFLFQTFGQQLAVIGIGKEIAQTVALEFARHQPEQLNGIVIGQENLIVAEAGDDNRERR